MAHPRTQRYLLLDIMSGRLAPLESNATFIIRMACSIAGLIKTNLMGKKSQVTSFACSRALPHHHLHQVWGKLLLSSHHHQCKADSASPSATVSRYATDRLAHTPVVCCSRCLCPIVKAWFIVLPFAALMGRHVLTQILLKHDEERRR